MHGTSGTTGSEACLLVYSVVGKSLIFPIRPFKIKASSRESTSSSVNIDDGWIPVKKYIEEDLGVNTEREQAYWDKEGAAVRTSASISSTVSLGGYTGKH